MKIELDILNKYVDEDWVVKNDHPSLPLSIYNYSRKTQYEGKWDEVTLQCRGLIVDNTTGNPIVRPFKKFFNYEEVIGKIPTDSEYVYVQEKMDGSLGILFNYKGEWIMSTRGSFVSEQSIRGLQILKSKYNLENWIKDCAYLVEILYDENRIVVNYNEDKIVFLSVVINESYSYWDSMVSNELNWVTANAILNANGIEHSDIVKTEQYFSFSDELYKKLKSENENNKEGYVLRFYPGNFRMKIKFEEYVRLHRILTQFSNVDIWEYLKDGKNLSELLDRVPDEFDNWVKETVRDLVVRYENIEKEYKLIFSEISLKIDVSDRKEFAEMAKRYPHPNILFKLLDNKDSSQYIWKIIRPTYSKPFWKKDNDE